MTIQDVVSDSLKKGTGRALLMIRDNPGTDFSDIIFNACINALGYDPQCEGNRAEYLYEIIQASKQSFLLEQKLTEAIISEEIEEWDLIQLFGLVKIFAEKGNKTARKNLYSKFISHSESKDDQALGISTEELIDLDGLEALKLVAEIRGKQLLESASDWEDSYLLDYTKDTIPESNPLEYLEKLAVDNQYIKTYLNKIKEHEQQVSDRPKSEWTYEVAKELILKKNYGFYGFRKWFNRDIMQQIAEDFINEKDIEVAKKYLKAFMRYEFPLDFKYLIPFTKDSDEVIRDYALRAISFFKNSDVRGIALTNLNYRVDISSSLIIIVNNFEEQDYQLIEQIVFELNENDNHHSHNISSRIIDIYEKNKTKFSLNALQTCYKKGHCSICRKKIVDLMLRDHTLPDWIQEEAVYDCNSEIRTLVLLNK